MIEPKHAIVVNVDTDSVAKSVTGESLGFNVYSGDLAVARLVAQGYPFLWVTTKPLSKRSIKVVTDDDVELSHIPRYRVANRKLAEKLLEYHGQDGFICAYAQHALRRDDVTPAFLSNGENMGMGPTPRKVLYITPRKRGWRKS